MSDRWARISRTWLAGLVVFWLLETPVLAGIGAFWGIDRTTGEVIAVVSVAPFLIPVFVGLVCFFGGEVLAALRGEEKTP